MKHHIAIYFDARFIGLQKDCCCDNVFATAKTMKSKGVEFEKEPKKEEWGTAAIFKDVDGNKFVLSSK